MTCVLLPCVTARVLQLLWTFCKTSHCGICYRSTAYAENIQNRIIEGHVWIWCISYTRTTYEYNGSNVNATCPCLYASQYAIMIIIIITNECKCRCLCTDSHLSLYVDRRRTNRCRETEKESNDIIEWK